MAPPGSLEREWVLGALSRWGFNPLLHSHFENFTRRVRVDRRLRFGASRSASAVQFDFSSEMLPRRLLVSLLSALACSPSAAQFPPGMLEAMPKKAKPAPLDSDVPFIKCGTCRILAEHAYEKTVALLGAQKPTSAKKRKLESKSNLGGLEEDVETMIQNVCNSEDPEGSWMREYDIVKTGSSLTLK